MQLKDYYTTLELTPAATALQIKKSFRQLALQYHPDKNPGNAMAEARFKEIQEAYEILSDPAKREEYNYKRWYSRTLKKQFSNEPLTAKAILAECVRLNDYMSVINIFSIDYDGLSYHIRQLLSGQNIGILQQAADKKIIREVTEKILQTAAALPFTYIEPIAVQLIRLANGDQSLTGDIHHFTRQHRQQSLWQKYRAPVVIFITVFICWIIYLVSR